MITQGSAQEEKEAILPRRKEKATIRQMIRRAKRRKEQAPGNVQDEDQIAQAAKKRLTDIQAEKGMLYDEHKTSNKIYAVVAVGGGWQEISEK